MVTSFLGFFDGKYKTISCSDDGRQPKNEKLLYIGYPTGAYIFGNDYPTEFFQKLFLELKTYNNCIYAIYRVYTVKNRGITTII